MSKLCLEILKSSIFHSKYIYCLLKYEILQILLLLLWVCTLHSSCLSLGNRTLAKRWKPCLPADSCVTLSHLTSLGSYSSSVNADLWGPFHCEPNPTHQRFTLFFKWHLKTVFLFEIREAREGEKYKKMNISSFTIILISEAKISKYVQYNWQTSGSLTEFSPATYVQQI